MNIELIIENAQLKGRVIALDAEVKCLEAVIRAHERVDCLSVTGLKKQLEEADAENARLKAEVERLTEAVKFNFHGGDQLLADLSKLLTAHRYYCDINAIDYSKMEKDALNAAKKGGQSK